MKIALCVILSLGALFGQETTKVGMVRVSGHPISDYLPIKRVEPVYPRLAKQARVHGKVVFNATFGKNGHLKELKLLTESHPLLVAASEKAFKQWCYRPLKVNGEVVEFQIYLEVNFILPPIDGLVP